jgi:hypothetical protein
MEPGNRDLEMIENKLSAAWREPSLVPGESWQKRLMQDIREEGVPCNGESEGIGTTAFRLAIAAGIAAFILLGIAFYSGIMPDMELSALFVFDPGGSLISPPFSLV